MIYMGPGLVKGPLPAWDSHVPLAHRETILPLFPGPKGSKEGIPDDISWNLGSGSGARADFVVPTSEGGKYLRRKSLCLFENWPSPHANAWEGPHGRLKGEHCPM